jgi:hypothetical protein
MWECGGREKQGGVCGLVKLCSLIACRFVVRKAPLSIDYTYPPLSHSQIPNIRYLILLHLFQPAQMDIFQSDITLFSCCCICISKPSILSRGPW